MIDQTAAREPDRTVSLWKSELERADKKFKAWQGKADKINEKYRASAKSSPELEQKRPQFSLLWSNVQTLKPALYANPPTPVVQRRYLDRDPVGRLGCQILERCLKYERDSGHLHRTMKKVVNDYALIGRGVAWVRYDAKIVSVPVIAQHTGLPLKTAEGETITQERIDEESIPVDYVHYKDFRHGSGRVWDEVPWVAKRVFLSREKLVALTDGEGGAGADVGKSVPLNFGPDGDKSKQDQTVFEELQRAEVWEIWAKDTRKVVWICADYSQGVLKELDDPLDLDGFFPCPEPVYSTEATDDTVPIPDYLQYQGQAIEIDDLTMRADRLAAACRAIGVYDAGQPALGRIFTEGVENDLIPVESWAAFAAQGGLKGALDFIPIEQYANALQVVQEAKAAAKADVYEITGLADIIRGNSDPDETAKAQQIKGQYASVRLKDRQRDIQRFARDLIAIQAEIICGQFQDETLWDMSGAAEMDEATDPQSGQMSPQFQDKFKQAVALLRDERQRGFRVDIETDSTIQADETAERNSRVQFIEAMGSLIGQALPAVEKYPALAPLMGHTILFAVRGFRVGRELETILEQAIDGMMKNGIPQPPDFKAQAQQMKAQGEQQKLQGQMQMQGQKHQMDMQAKAVDLQATQIKAGAEIQKAAIDNHMANLDHQRQMQLATQGFPINPGPPNPPVMQPPMTVNPPGGMPQ